MSAPPAKVYKIGVCLYPNVAGLDFHGSVELLGMLSTAARKKMPILEKDAPNVAIELVFLSHSLDLVEPFVGPKLAPDRTYDDPKNEELNVLLVPGGPDVLTHTDTLRAFLKKQYPKLDYLLSVCTGSWILAEAGLLDGKRATSNKSSFREIKEATKHRPITWIAQARWVVDGNIWTSSGVTAGLDLAIAWLEHVAGEEWAAKVRGVVELSAHGQGDDEFAELFNLV